MEVAIMNRGSMQSDMACFHPPGLQSLIIKPYHILWL